MGAVRANAGVFSGKRTFVYSVQMKGGVGFRELYNVIP